MSAELGIPIAVGSMSALVLGVAQLRRHLAIDAESARKIVHIGSALLAMSFPWLFGSTTSVVAACAISAALLALCRHTSLFPRRVKNVLEGVQRRSVGEYCFALAIAILFPLSRDNWILYLVPLAILAFSDTAAAIVGLRWGKTRLFALAGLKSIEGSLAFFVTTIVIAAAMLTALTDLDPVTAVFVSTWLALATTLTEAVSTGGTDNLSVPLVGYLLLKLSLGGQAYGP
jgi:phytol kinase